MAKYNVPVCRISYSVKKIEVEAETQEEANNLAIEQAPNEDFGTGHTTDYKLEGAVPEPNRVLIHLMGGVVQDIFADRPDEIVPIVRDFDIEGSEIEIAETGELFTDGSDHYQEVERFVSHMTNLDTQPFACPVNPEDL